MAFNTRLAEELDFDPTVLEHEGPTRFSGNQAPDDANPIALAYADHQFGGFVPQLGDGRAILLGERVRRDGVGVRRDIQLKGTGRTPFSRNGDGRTRASDVLRHLSGVSAIRTDRHSIFFPATPARSPRCAALFMNSVFPL